MAYNFFFIYLWAVVEPSPLLLQEPWLINGDNCGAVSGMNDWWKKPKYSEEFCPSAALSITDST
jgi:hypothetical protein